MAEQLTGSPVIRWRNRNIPGVLDIEGTNIYRSTSPMDIDNMPTPYDTVAGDITYYADMGAVYGETYYYRIGVFDDVEEKITDEEVLMYRVGEKVYSGPGSQELIAGTFFGGFFGAVPPIELTNGSALANFIGLTTGNSRNSNQPWLKFAIDEKIIFVAQKPLRDSVSWDNIHNANAVYASQNNIITIGDDSYILRLMKGADNDPFDGPASLTSNPSYSQGSEWNRLMYNIHADSPNGISWASYSDSDLGLSTDPGRSSWCQETMLSDAGRRVYRGGLSISNFGATLSSYNGTDVGWRPVLELIPS